MKSIVVEVDDTVGEIYSMLNQENKKKFDRTISMMIKKAANDANYDDYTKLLDESGYEAVRNGLTPEILESLLASND